MQGWPNRICPEVDKLPSFWVKSHRDLLYLVVGDHGHDLHIVAATRDEEGDARVLPDLLRVSLLLAPRTRPEAGKEEVKERS